MFHALAHHRVAPHVELGAEILRVGKADLPVAEGAAAAPALGDNAGIPGNKARLDMSDKFLAEDSASQSAGARPAGASCSLPHIRQREHFALAAHGDAIESESGQCDIIGRHFEPISE